MDGARFSNACASLNVKPAELSWKNGIDILSLGTTKNGTISCEAIIVFNQEIIDDLERRQKRTGHLWSKNKKDVLSLKYRSRKLDFLTEIHV